MYNPVPPKSPTNPPYSASLYTKKFNATKVVPWLLTLVLHGLIFAAGYFLYMHTIQQNAAISASQATAKAASKSITAQAASTPAVTQPASASSETLKTITEPNQPIAITEEKYLPSPRVRSDLPILTAASIAAADPSKAAQRAVQDQVADELTKMVIGAIGTQTPNAAAAAADGKTPANAVAPALNPVLTDRDVPEQEKRALQKNGQPLNPTKNTKIGTTKASPSDKSNSDSKTQNADNNQKSTHSKINKTVTNAADSVDDANDELSKNIDLVKNKNRQKIAREFGTANKSSSNDDADDALQAGIDEPTHAHTTAHKKSHQ